MSPSHEGPPPVGIPAGQLRVAMLDLRTRLHRNRETWGEQNHPDGTSSAEFGSLETTARATLNFHAAEGRVTYTDILREEFYEALASDTPAHLRDELLDAAAVAIDWIMKLDREAAAKGIVL